MEFSDLVIFAGEMERLFIMFTIINNLTIATIINTHTGAC